MCLHGKLLFHNVAGQGHFGTGWHRAVIKQRCSLKIEDITVSSYYFAKSATDVGYRLQEIIANLLFTLLSSLMAVSSFNSHSFPMPWVDLGLPELTGWWWKLEGSAITKYWCRQHRRSQMGIWPQFFNEDILARSCMWFVVWKFTLRNAAGNFSFRGCHRCLLPRWFAKSRGARGSC